MLLTGSPKNLKIWNNLDFEKLEKKNLKIYFENYFFKLPKKKSWAFNYYKNYTTYTIAGFYVKVT